MKHYLDERLDELRSKFQETSDVSWLHRFSECKHIREWLVVQDINKELKHGDKTRGQESAGSQNTGSQGTQSIGAQVPHAPGG